MEGALGPEEVMKQYGSTDTVWKDPVPYSLHCPLSPTPLHTLALHKALPETRHNPRKRRDENLQTHSD